MHDLCLAARQRRKLDRQSESLDGVVLCSRGRGLSGRRYPARFLLGGNDFRTHLLLVTIDAGGWRHCTVRLGRRRQTCDGSGTGRLGDPGRLPAADHLYRRGVVRKRRLLGRYRRLFACRTVSAGCLCRGGPSQAITEGVDGCLGYGTGSGGGGASASGGCHPSGLLQPQFSLSSASGHSAGTGLCGLPRPAAAEWRFQC